MSNSYDLRCVDCAETHSFDDNRSTESIQTLIRHADAIAALAPMMAEEPFLNCPSLTLGFNRGSCGAIDAAWFAAHAGHHLAVIDEYGRLLDECGNAVSCGACGHVERCRLTPRHSGPCSSTRPK